MKFDPRNLPSTDEIQRTIFRTFQERKGWIVGGLVLLAAAAILLIVVLVSRAGESDEIQTRLLQAYEDSRRDPGQGVASYEEILREAAGSELEPRVLWDLALACRRAAESAADVEAAAFLDQGIETLNRLELDFPESRWTLAPDPSDPNATRLRKLRGKMESDRKWLSQHTYRHPEVDEGLQARIETRFGNIKIGFFGDLAPEHVKNFVGLAKKGFYNGLLVHEVIPGWRIAMGDPNTRDRIDRSEYGKGGPGYSLSPEDSRYKVNHLRGVVSAVRDMEDSGSQFFICVVNANEYDKRNSPFGEVIEGLDVVDSVSQVQTQGTDPSLRETAGRDIPTQDILIRSISIWKDGKLDEGHTWDTSIVGTTWSEPDVAEPEAPGVSPELQEKIDGLVAEATKLEAEGKHAEAMEKLKEVLEIDASHPTAVEMLAGIRAKLDD